MKTDALTKPLLRKFFECCHFLCWYWLTCRLQPRLHQLEAESVSIKKWYWSSCNFEKTRIRRSKSHCCLVLSYMHISRCWRLYCRQKVFPFLGTVTLGTHDVQQRSRPYELVSDAPTIPSGKDNKSLLIASLVVCYVACHLSDRLYHIAATFIPPCFLLIIWLMSCTRLCLCCSSLLMLIKFAEPTDRPYSCRPMPRSW